MDDKCPFCGAAPGLSIYEVQEQPLMFGDWLYYSCGSHKCATSGEWDRSKRCLIAQLGNMELMYQSLAGHCEVHEQDLADQLAAQSILLRDAAEVVRWVERTFAYTHAGMHTKATALLPRLEAAGKGKP